MDPTVESAIWHPTFHYSVWSLGCMQRPRTLEDPNMKALLRKHKS